MEQSLPHLCVAQVVNQAAGCGHHNLWLPPQHTGLHLCACKNVQETDAAVS